MNINNDVTVQHNNKNVKEIESSPKYVMVKEIGPQFYNRLYAKILRARDVTYLASYWMAAYSFDKTEPLYDLYQFYIDLAGYQFINVNKFNETRLISHLVSYMESCNVKIYAGKYFLLSKTNSDKTKRLKIEHFITIFINMCCKEKFLYDRILFDKLFEFFRLMSNSQIRSIKHTGVFFALIHQTGLIRIVANIIQDITSHRNKIDNEQNDEVINKIKQELEQLENYMEILNKMIVYLQHNIFMQNWNCGDPKLYLMRQDCILELYKWMEILSHKYIQPEFLNLIIGSFIDRHKAVRITALEIIGQIIMYCSSKSRSFFPKLIEPLTKQIRDIHYGVSSLAVHNLTLIHRTYPLPDAVREVIFTNIYNINYPLAAACGRFLVEYIIQKNRNKGDEGLLRLLIIFECKLINLGKADKHPFMIEAIYDNFSILQNIKLYMNILEDKEFLKNNIYTDVWLKILTESCQQTFTGHCSSIRIKPRKGKVYPEKVKQMIEELNKSLNTLIAIFGLEKLSTLLTLIKTHSPKPVVVNLDVPSEFY